MNKQDFILQLREQLELESTLDENTNFKKLDEWDSMNAMVLIGFVSENFSVDLTAKDIEKIDTVADLIDRIGEGKFETN